jgi:hypothetical protein
VELVGFGDVAGLALEFFLAVGVGNFRAPGRFLIKARETELP